MTSREIRLACGTVSLVDADLYEELSRYKWQLDYRGYLRRSTTLSGRIRKTIFLHRCVVNAQPDQMVDHINGNPLDNRRENLRFAIKSQNHMNMRKRVAKPTSSQFKGVGLDKRSGKWRACIKINKKTKYLGMFASEHEAGHAYNKAAIQYFGEFACLNPVGEGK